MYVQIDSLRACPQRRPILLAPPPQAFSWGEVLLTACVIGGGFWLLGKAVEEPPKRRRRQQRRDTYVYRLRASGRPVYFGISNEPERRCAEHLTSGKYFEAMEVLSVAITRGSALARERATLNAHRRRYGCLPQYNKI